MSQNLPEQSLRIFCLYVILTISYLRAQTIETSSLPTDSSRPQFEQIEIFSSWPRRDFASRRNPCGGNKRNKFFIMLERNSINAHSKTRPQLTLQKWESAGRIGDFGNFLNSLAKSPRVLRSSWIVNEYNLKYCILSEVCMIKTVPRSTVSPQMWCINCIKG